MKKTFYLLMLFISITLKLCAQLIDSEDKAFRVPEDVVITSRFYIDLKNSNKFTIEVSDFNDLKSVGNIDSILMVFLKDIEPLKDSFSSPLSAKHIDYITDAAQRKKIRFRQTIPAASSFLISNGDLSSLRTTQDTISLIGVIVNPSKPKQKIDLSKPRYYHFTFYLNDFAELKKYMNGTLAQKITTIKNNTFKERWRTVLGSGWHYLKSDNSITADQPNGTTSGTTTDFLTGNITVNAQNYKNYFVPSFTIGVKLTFSNRSRSYKWEPGLFWEPQFLFNKDAQNKLRTYRNDFLLLTYGQGGTKDHDPRKDFSFSTLISVGYLINRNGDFYEKNTFRLGLGKINMLKTTVEPCMYFDNFFKGVTPGIRISQYF